MNDEISRIYFFCPKYLNWETLVVFFYQKEN